MDVLLAARKVGPAGFVDAELSAFPISLAQIQAGLDTAGCIFGAMTVEQLTGLLDGAGFSEIDATIQRRYRPDELLNDLDVNGPVHRI